MTTQTVVAHESDLYTVLEVIEATLSDMSGSGLWEDYVVSGAVDRLWEARTIVREILGYEEEEYYEDDEEFEFDPSELRFE